MPAWSVQFSPEAIQELQQAIDYYNFQRSGLGIEFMIEFEEHIQELTVNPLTRAIRYLEVRFALVDRFPYAIHYVVREEKHMVIIQTVLSTYKDPQIHWRER